MCRASCGFPEWPTFFTSLLALAINGPLYRLRFLFAWQLQSAEASGALMAVAGSCGQGIVGMGYDFMTAF
jgi:hypothetical protein